MATESGSTAARAAGTAIRVAGIPPEDMVSCEPLSGGTYNALFRISLRDGRRWVVKIPPSVSLPGLGYERDLLRGEVEFYTAVGADGSVPVPDVVRYETDPGAATGAFLIMSACPGTPWQELDGELAPEERTRLRRELGGLVARTHTVTGPGFGYPARPFGPLAGSWREAFTAMVERLLEDAVRYGARLPRTPDAIHGLMTGASEVLDEVTVPVAVHFDLWQETSCSTARPVPVPSAESSTASGCSGAIRSRTSSPWPCSVRSRRTPTSSPDTRRRVAWRGSGRRPGCGWRSTAAISI